MIPLSTEAQGKRLAAVFIISTETKVTGPNMHLGNAG